MKKAFIVLCLICLCSGSVYALESADVPAQAVEPTSVSMNPHQGQELIKTSSFGETMLDMQRELLELKKELRDEVQCRSDSFIDQALSLLTFFIALITLSVGLFGFVGWSKVKQAEREYDRAEKEMLEIKDKYKRQAKKISRVYDNAKKAEDDISKLLGKNFDPDEPFYSNDLKEIDSIISTPLVPIVTRLQAMALKMQENKQWDKALFLWEVLEGLTTSEAIKYLAGFYVAYCLIKNKRNNKANEKFKFLSETGPVEENLYLHWGRSLIDLGCFDEAIEKFHKALELDPDYFAPYRSWGIALFKQGDLEGAMEKFNKALELNPKSYLSYLDWGKALFEKRDFDGAIEKFRKALELRPDNCSLYFNWGKALFEKRDFDGAIEKFRKALELRPDNCSLYFNWGKVLFKKRDFDGAIEKFRKVLELRPDDYFAYLNWGKALFKKGDFDGAIEKFRKVLELRPDDYFTYLNLGKVLFKKGDFDGVAEQYRKASELPNPDCYLYLLCSEALSHLIDETVDPDLKHKLEKEAEEKFSKAIELGYDPESAATDDKEE